MKRLIIKTIFILFLFSLAVFFIPKTKAQENIFFYGNGCHYCAKVETYFNDHQIFDKYNISKKEIYANGDNAKLYNDITDEHNIPVTDRGVPLLYIDGKVISGANNIIDYFEKGATGNGQGELCNSQDSTCQNETAKTKLTLPILLSAAAVDAFNPCEFAILILLMANIIAAGNAKKRNILAVGFAFIFAIYLSYFLMGIGIYHALATIQFSQIFTKIIGVIALIIGLANLKDYFWYGGGGFVMEIPRRWRPKMNNLIRSVVSPAGAFVVGLAVSLFLLPCTSGPYVVILGMLSEKTTRSLAIGWLSIYNLVFVLPMIVVALATTFGMSPARAETIRRGKIQILHLIAGILMIGLGIIILTNII